jgi:ubiquinol-cytochrome c reductase cytochrome c1 subunit
MKRIFFMVFMASVSSALWASSAVQLEQMPVNLNDKSSMQRGAKYYVNYCMGCHSLEYSRYNRVAKDLGMTDKQVEQNLIFTGQKVGELMINAMPVEDSAQWFGISPPDLTVISRVRGADWLYSYLKGFYLDESRPYGVNNAVFPNVGMPHVLWQLEGLKRPVHGKESTDDAHGGGHAPVKTQYETLVQGSMNTEEYDRAVRDLVNFLVYVGEPAQLVRRHGIWAILVLILFLIAAYALKQDYWEEVH